MECPVNRLKIIDYQQKVLSVMGGQRGWNKNCRQKESTAFGILHPESNHYVCELTDR